MHDSFDFVRLVAALIAIPVVIGCLLIAFVVRNARKWGCFALIFAGVGVTGGNLTKLGQPPTIWTLFLIGSMSCGLMYVAKVMGEKGWRDRQRPKGH